MDVARSWNTRGIGKLGAATLGRGFARTHFFAQARSVFAVAAYRCAEVFDPPNCVTLWRLPDSVEEEFDARWDYWLEQVTEWTPFFQRIALIRSDNLVDALHEFELIGI